MYLYVPLCTSVYLYVPLSFAVIDPLVCLLLAHCVRLFTTPYVPVPCVLLHLTVPLHAVMDPPMLCQYVKTYRVTHWNSVPQLGQMLCDYLTPETAPMCCSLEYLLMSGDAIPRALPARMEELLPELHQVSMGGHANCSTQCERSV